MLRTSVACCLPGVALWGLIGLAAAGQAQQPPADASAGESLKQQMQALAKATKVVVKGERGDRAAELIPQPVFRYSDQPRNIFDATLWAWQVDGRPVLLQKIEADLDHIGGGPRWTQCLTSFAEELIEVELADGKRYRSRTPGIVWKPLSDAPPPADRAVTRRRQFKQLASRFAATITLNPEGPVRQEMRPLTTPLLEFSTDGDSLPTGALFALTANGTNPDAYVILELRSTAGGPPAWRYGAARMTICGVQLRLDEQEVWSVPWVPPEPTAFESWTFYYAPREVK